ncbi:MAG: hypothetical protein QXG97_00575 [Nitrososphaerota archaeon]
MKVLELLSWKPLCVSMPAEELTMESWHPRFEVADKDHGIIRCPSCGKEWLGVRKWKDVKKELIF